MITETKESVTFQFNDEEVIGAIANLIRLRQFCEKIGGHDELAKDLQTAIEIMKWAYCELFGGDEE